MGVPFSRPIFLLTGDLYPGYQTFKALESQSPSEMKQWLAYWVVRGCMRGGEWFIGNTAQKIIPMYTWFKLMFFAWLVSPQYRGALQCYTSLVRPYLLKHEQEIDTAGVKITTQVSTRVRAASITAMNWLNVKKKQVGDQLVREIKKAAVESINSENKANNENIRPSAPFLDVNNVHSVD